MATFYNTSTVGYSDSGTPYNGAPNEFVYAGSITIQFTPNYNIEFNSTDTTFYYTGTVSMAFNVGASYAFGRSITTTTGLRIIIAPSSTMVHRRYLKIKDPIRTGGCVQCGTYLYNERC